LLSDQDRFNHAEILQLAAKVTRGETVNQRPTYHFSIIWADLSLNRFSASAWLQPVLN
jgi:hypothetical protein